MSDTIQLNTKALDALTKALKGKLPVVKIGIIGKKNSRDRGRETNPSIGAKHEFGDPATNLPQRSFLRMPITEHLNKYLEQSGAFDKNALNKVVKQASIREWLGKVAIVSEKVVSDAFATGGWGNWPAWKIPGYENNTGLILVDTQQLRNSISSEVK